MSPSLHLDGSLFPAAETPDLQNALFPLPKLPCPTKKKAKNTKHEAIDYIFLHHGATPN